MQKIVLNSAMVLILALPCFLLAGELNITQADKETLNGYVVYVNDGDSFVLKVGKKHHKIRLFGIDCPEKDQSFSKEADAFTRNAILKKQVKVVVHDVDKYRRKVGVVYTTNGMNLNEELISKGLAWWYQHYNDDTRLKQLEQQARRQKLGLWIVDNPTQPWKFRRANK